MMGWCSQVAAVLGLLSVRFATRRGVVQMVLSLQLLSFIKGALR